MTATATKTINKRPRGGELVVDWDNYAIHGVLLLARESANGYIYNDEAIDACVRISNRIPVQEQHFKQAAGRRNGQIRDAYRDGKVARGSWYLNRKNPQSEQFLVDADDFPENIVLSLESPVRDTPERINADGRREVYDIKSISFYAIEPDGGVAKSLSSPRIEGKNMTINTVEELRQAYPKLVASIEADAEKRIECACKEAEANQATITKERDEATKERDEALTELAGYKEREALDKRRSEIIAEYAELLGEINSEQVPEELRPKLALEDEELDIFVKQPADVVTVSLKSRAELIKGSLKTIERLHGQGPVIAPPRKESPTVQHSEPVNSFDYI